MPQRAARAAVIAVGTEITEGRIPNSNAALISRRLLAAGVETVLHVAVPDDLALIERALRDAAAQADVLIVTGGLGPTLDDITREAAARLAGVGLETDPAALERIEKIFAALGRPMRENNRRQAERPAGAESIPNDLGTAPGFRMKLAGADAFFLPGVPHEMEAMLERSVLPALEARFLGGGAVEVRRLNCFGLSESEIDHVLAPLFREGDIELAFNIDDAAVQIYLTCRGAPAREAARARLDEAAARVRSALGASVFSEGPVGLEEALASLLRERRLTIGLAESCTGGLATARLARVPGVSEALRGAVVAYSNEAKIRLLGVPEALIAACGAVSREVALAMAEGARRALAADVGVAITGIAGPTGGTPEKPVGLVHIAVALGETTRERELRFFGERTRVQLLAAMAALEQVRRAILFDSRSAKGGLSPCGDDPSPRARVP
jgi:nicotinamide-nucleotide amidase